MRIFTRTYGLIIAGTLASITAMGVIMSPSMSLADLACWIGPNAIPAVVGIVIGTAVFLILRTTGSWSALRLTSALIAGFAAATFGAAITHHLTLEILMRFDEEFHMEGLGSLAMVLYAAAGTGLFGSVFGAGPGLPLAAADRGQIDDP